LPSSAKSGPPVYYRSKGLIIGVKAFAAPQMIFNDFDFKNIVSILAFKQINNLN